MRRVALDQEIVNIHARPHASTITPTPIPKEWDHGSRALREVAVWRIGAGPPESGSLPRPSLAPDLLVELDAVAPLGRVPALLPADAADPAEELVAVAPLRG